MRRVIVESPYAGDIELNEEYARAACSDCIHRGESPYASHLLLTQPGILRDDDPEERKLGILAGFEWAVVADAIVVYTDLGVTPGMIQGIENHEEAGRTVERRSLPEWKNRKSGE